MSEDPPVPASLNDASTVPDPAAPGKGPTARRKKGRRLLAVLLILAPWWAPNLPPLKPWLEQQLSRRTGWHCRIGYVLPCGLNGRPILGRLRLASHSAPESGSRLFWGKASFLPRWSALFKGQLILEELRLENGEAILNPTSARPESAPDSEAAPPLPLLLSTKPLPSAAEAPKGQVVENATREADHPPPDSNVGLLSSLSHNDDRAQPSPSRPEEPVASTPVEATEIETAATATEPLPSSAPPPSTSSPSAQTEAPLAPISPAPPARQWSIERLVVDNLHVRLLMPHDPSRELVGVEVASVHLPLGTSSGEGEVHLTSCEVLGHAWHEPLKLPLLWDAGVLRVKEAALPMPGGTVTLSMHAEPLNPGAPLLAIVQGAVLKAEAIYAWLTSSSAQHNDLFTTHSPDLCPPAELGFQLQLGGFLRWPMRSFQTRGIVEMRPTNLPLAAWLKAAGWPEAAATLAEPEMPASSARFAFRSHDGTVAIDEAALTAQDFLFQSRGTLSISTGWALATRTYVRESARGLLSHVTQGWPSERQLALTPLPDSPWAYLDAPVQGPLLQPSVGLWGQWWDASTLRAELARLRALPRPMPHSDNK